MSALVGVGVVALALGYVLGRWRSDNKSLRATERLIRDADEAIARAREYEARRR